MILPLSLSLFSSIIPSLSLSTRSSDIPGLSRYAKPIIPGSTPPSPIPLWSQEYDKSKLVSKYPTSSSKPLSPPIALSTQYPKATSFIS